MYYVYIYIHIHIYIYIHIFLFIYLFTYTGDTLMAGNRENLPGSYRHLESPRLESLCTKLLSKLCTKLCTKLSSCVQSCVQSCQVVYKVSEPTPLLGAPLSLPSKNLQLSERRPRSLKAPDDLESPTWPSPAWHE